MTINFELNPLQKVESIVSYSLVEVIIFISS
jgi:hypothetical protein